MAHETVYVTFCPLNEDYARDYIAQVAEQDTNYVFHTMMNCPPDRVYLSNKPLKELP